MPLDHEVVAPESTVQGSERDQKKIAAVLKRIDGCVSETSKIREKWRDNYDMFVGGSRFQDKQPWQSQFSTGKIEAAIRTAQAELVNTIIQNPDWYYFEPRSKDNQQAEQLAPAFRKLVDYYLEESKFKRHAGTFIMMSLISMGSIFVGSKTQLVQNPEYVLDKTQKEREKEQARLAKSVANPQVTDEEMQPDQLAESINSALDDLKSMATGDIPQSKSKKLEPYIQRWCLDFQDPVDQYMFWDPNVAYMEDSAWKAFAYRVNYADVKYWGKLGYVSAAKIKKMGQPPPIVTADLNYSARYKATTESSKSEKRTELIAYYGPLIIDDEVVKDRWFCLIGNRSVILKEGEYPFWEPPGHFTPIVNTAVRQIPHRATGAGIGDNAAALERMYDSNWQLVCDTFRFGIAGINVVDYQALVDKGALAEGVEPGKVIEVRGDPTKVFHRIQLTDNIENQVHPVQEMLRQAIEERTGINNMLAGAPNLRSRTTAAETQARLQGAEKTVNIIAIDLEQYFLIPVLQKVFARILQFGLDEVQTNPDLQALLNQDEQANLLSLNQGDRMQILNQFYRFKIRGFSAQNDAKDKLMRLNELIQIANSGGVFSQTIDPQACMRLWSKLMGTEQDDLLIEKATPLQQVTAEHSVLMGAQQEGLPQRMVIPSPHDDHKFHLQMHMPLANSPEATPELKQHTQIHQQMLQAQEAQQAQAQQGQGGPPPGQQMQ